jgi:hypothetical protein
MVKSEIAAVMDCIHEAADALEHGDELSAAAIQAALADGGPMAQYGAEIVGMALDRYRARRRPDVTSLLRLVRSDDNK